MIYSSPWIQKDKKRKKEQEGLYRIIMNIFPVDFWDWLIFLGFLRTCEELYSNHSAHVKAFFFKNLCFFCLISFPSLKENSQKI